MLSPFDERAGNDRTFEESLDGLDKAFGIQGGTNLNLIRTGSGIYLYHEINEYLSRRQTYQYSSWVLIDASAGAGDYQGYVPSSTGLRYGRYLTGVCVTANDTTALTGWTVLLKNSGLQPGYPVLAAPIPVVMGGNTARNYQSGSNILVPDFSSIRLPMWCPPGTVLEARVRTSAASGTQYFVAVVWNASEELRDNAPAGQPRSAIKV